MENVIDWASVQPEPVEVTRPVTATPDATPEVTPDATPASGAVDWDSVQPEAIAGTEVAPASPETATGWRDKIPLGIGKMIPDKWVSPAIPWTRIQDLSKKYGISEEEAAQYVAAKGGTMDMIGRRNIMANQTSAEEARNRGELLAWHGLASQGSGAARELANNVLTSVIYPKEQAVGANLDMLPFVNALDHFSGPKWERGFKDEVHDLLANNNSAYKTAMDMLYTAPTFAVAGEGLGAAAAVTGVSKLAAPVVAKATSLAGRMGLSEVTAKATVSAAVAYTKVATEAGLMQGTLEAVAAPSGHGGEAFVHGAEVGAAIATLGLTVGKVAGKAIEATPLNRALATKQLSNFGEKAAADMKDRIPETKQLLDVGHTGDITSLPRAINELTAYGEKIGVSSDVVESVARSKEYMESEGLSTDPEADMSRKVADRQAKVAVFNAAVKNFDETKTRVETKLLADMDAGKPLPTDTATLDKVAEVLGIDEADISRDARSLSRRSEFAMDMRKGYDNLPEADKTTLRTAAYTDAIKDHLTNIDRDELTTRNEIVQMRKSGNPQTFGLLEDLNSQLAKYRDALGITDSALRNKSNDIIGDARRSGIAPVDSTDTLKLAATQRAIKLHADLELADFATNYLPSFVKQAPRGNVDIGKLMRGIRGATDLEAAAGMEFVPKSIGDAARAAAENGTWKDGAKVLKTWATDIMKDRKTSDITMDGYREFIDKVIHDQGNNPEVVRNWFVQHQLNRKMQELAVEYRLGSRIPKQGVWDEAAKRALPAHVILDEIERRWPGTGMGEASIEINNGLQRAAQMADNIMEGARDAGLKSITDAVKSGAVDKHELFKLIDNPEHVVRGSREVQAATIKAAAEWRKVASYLLERARENDMHIEARENWIHHTTMSENDIIYTITSKMKELGIESGGEMEPSVFKSQLETNPEFAKLVDALEFSTGVKIASASDFADATFQLHDAAGVARAIAPQFAGAKSRAELGGIPELLLEHDINKLSEKYVRQMTQTSILTEPLAHLKAVADALDAVGAEAYKRGSGVEGRTGNTKLNIAAADAGFIRDFMGATSGAPKTGLLQEKILNPMSRNRAVKLAERWKGNPVMFDRAMKAPGYMSDIITGMLYSTMLLRPTSLFKHLTQPILAMAEELRHPEAATMGFNSSVKAAAALMRSKVRIFGNSEWARALDLMKERGMFPERIDDINRAGGSLRDIPGKVMEKTTAEGGLAGAAELSKYYAKIMTSPRVITENINRLGVLIFADDVLNAVKSGKMSSEQAFGKMTSPGMKAELMNAGKNLTDEHLSTYENYLNQKGHYVYNSPQKPQIIRDVGPLMGAFLRFGSEVTGTIYNRVRSGNMAALSEQMSRQAVWLILASKYIDDLGEHNERFKTLSRDIFGGEGLAHLHPAKLAASYLTAGAIPVMKQNYALSILSSMAGAATLDRKSTENLTRTILEALPGTRIGEILIDQIYTHGIRGRAEAPIGDEVKAIEKGMGQRVDWIRKHVGLKVKAVQDLE